MGIEDLFTFTFFAFQNVGVSVVESRLSKNREIVSATNHAVELFKEHDVLLLQLFDC